MANIALYLGAGYLGEDSLNKSWLTRLAGKHNIFVASRVGPDLNVMSVKRASELFGADMVAGVSSAIGGFKAHATSYSCVYDSPYATQHFTDNELASIENWLGIPFDYVSSLDRRFYNKDRMKDARDRHELRQCLARAALFFRDFFHDSQIDFFITTLEDDYPSVIANAVAKRQDVRVINFVQGGRFPKDGTMFCEDFSDVSIWSDQLPEWEKIESLYTSATLVAKSTQEKNKEHYALSSIPKRLRNIRWILNYERYVENIFSQNECEKNIVEEQDVRHQAVLYLRRMFRRLLVQRIAQEPNYDDRFLLFPLHYIEDAQITFREPLIDQYLLIRTISRALPTGVYLYVKPHPHYCGTDVSFKNLNTIRCLDNVKIISPYASTIELIKSSQVVVTINSTSGFEALIFGVPVVTFGHDFYCKKHLCYVVRDNNEIAKVLMDALNGRNRPDKEIIREFVKKVYANTVWAENQFDDATAKQQHSYDARRAEALDVIVSNSRLYQL